VGMAGGENIGAALEEQYAQISSEELLAQDPDIILLSDALYGVTPDSVAARAGWETMTAVENAQIFAFDPFLLSVPGPRLVDGLEEMARLLHPDLAP
ncbi:MAG: ABC transporter substrate-binding protein, partial [Anaerolineales bacterium]|nr:ABC transporter substrate-binding protein [Anaerolineales bacterium]